MFNRGEYSETMYLIICSTLSVLSAAGFHVHKSWGVHAAVTYYRHSRNPSLVSSLIPSFYRLQYEKRGTFLHEFEKSWERPGNEATVTQCNA